MATQATKAARLVFREVHGVVVSSGLMERTVKVRVGGQKWDPRVQRVSQANPPSRASQSGADAANPQTLAKPKHFLVHDPNSSLRTGDVVAVVPGWRTSKHKRHVIKHIIAPASVPIEARPPVPTLDERIEERDNKKRAKDERRAARRAEEEEARLNTKATKAHEASRGLAGSELD